MSKRIWLLALVLVALAFTNAQESRAQSGGTVDEVLIANERALQNAVSKADKASFLSLALPEGTWTTAGGFVPVKLLVNGLDAFHLNKSDVVNPHVTRLGDDAAVVLYIWTVAGTYSDQPLPSTMASANQLTSAVEAMRC